MAIRCEQANTAQSLLDISRGLYGELWRGEATREAQRLAACKSGLAELDEGLGKLLAGASEADKQVLGSALVAVEQYRSGVNAIVAARDLAGQVAARRLVAYNAMLDAAKKLTEQARASMGGVAATTAQTTSNAVMTVSVGVTIALLIGTSIAVLLTLSIIRPIKRIIDGLTAGAQQTAAASQQVGAASQSLAQGASDQAAGIQEVTASVEEMSAMAKQSAANAKQARETASAAATSADKGSGAMDRMSSAIDDITRQRGSEKECAAHRHTLCAKIALIATALVKVDLPEAFEPVISIGRSQRRSLRTGFAISGCANPSARRPGPAENAGAHSRSPDARRLAIATQASISPTRRYTARSASPCR